MHFMTERRFSQERPAIQMTPLIDMMFILLIFYMAASVFFQLESEINISVPVAGSSNEMSRMPGEVIINVTRDGSIFVNQKELSMPELKVMLKRVSELYGGQPVIIRADRETYHADVVGVLDACAEADIWNVSFATMKEEAE
ncbi:MAG: biopolymer transporter ExbD [Candidatus Omnitrophica bacterium]|nr:biopolymer transporter ExbD [Candidatus Omnitrophota bacterium]MDD4013090.1 biopolymer transporter ExbD [Candidatus Omnitrophota bacterium]